MLLWNKESQIVTTKYRGWTIHEDSTGIWIVDRYGPALDADSMADAYARIDDEKEARR